MRTVSTLPLLCGTFTLCLLFTGYLHATEGFTDAGTLGFGDECNGTTCPDYLSCSGEGYCLCPKTNNIGIQDCAENFIKVNVTDRLTTSVHLSFDIISGGKAVSFDRAFACPESGAKCIMEKDNQQLFQNMTPGQRYDIYFDFTYNVSTEDGSFQMKVNTYTFPAKPANIKHRVIKNGTVEFTWHQKGVAERVTCRLERYACNSVYKPETNCSISRQPSNIDGVFSCRCSLDSICSGIVELEGIEIAAFNGQGDRSAVYYAPNVTYIPESIRNAIDDLTVASVSPRNVTLELTERAGGSYDIGYYVVTIDPGNTCVAFRRQEHCSEPAKAKQCRPGILSTRTITVPSTPQHQIPVSVMTPQPTPKATTLSVSGPASTASAAPAILSTPSSTTAVPSIATTPPPTTGAAQGKPDTSVASASPGIVPTPPSTTLSSPGSGTSAAVAPGVGKSAWPVSSSAIPGGGVSTPATNDTPVIGIPETSAARQGAADRSESNESGRRRRQATAPDVVTELIQLEISDLQPANLYSFTVLPFFCNLTEAGKEKRADAFVASLNVTTIENNVIVLWEKSEQMLHVLDVTLVDAVEIPVSSCSGRINARNRTSLTSCNATSCWGDNTLSGFWEYNVIVTLKSTDGPFKSHMFHVTTQPTAPGPVDTTSLAVITWVDDKTCAGRKPTNRSVVCITWLEICPRDRNSRINHYEVILFSADTGKETGREQVTSKLTALSDALYRRNHARIWHQVAFTGTPGKTYKVKVRAVNTNRQVGRGATKRFQIPDIAEPDVPDQQVVLNQYVPRDRVTSSASTIQFRVTSTRFLVVDEGNHCLSRFLIITAGGRHPDSNITAVDYPGYASRYDALKQGGYRIDDSVLSKLPDCKNWNANNGGQLTITVGDEGNCSDQAQRYCDGPLDQDIMYSIWVKLCNEAHCKTLVLVEDQQTVGEDEATNATFTWYMVLIVVAIIACFVICVLVVTRVPFGRREQSSSFPRVFRSAHFMRRYKEKCPMKLVTLESVITQKLRDDAMKLRGEYEDLRAKTLHNCPSESDSLLDINRAKNRYVDILTCNHSRVKLSPDENGSDYINANFIPGYNSEKEYIAAQGPLPSTVPDFWRMVWEHRVPVIVMLTLPVEYGKVKCEQYWPEEEGESDEFENLTVTANSVTNLSDYNITVFDVSKTESDDQPLKVTHFHYQTWPDMTADITPYAIIDFITAVRECFHSADPGIDGPILVHCSAGVGRTGTFMAIEYAMQFIDQRSLTDSLDIYAYIERLRQYRCKMVQTEAQYIFIHQCARFLMASRRRRDEELIGNGGDDNAEPSATYLTTGDTDDKEGSRLSLANGDVRELAMEPSDMDTVELDTTDAWQVTLEDISESADPPVATSSTENLYTV